MTKKGERIKTANGEFPLPEAIIQHIQSFMSGKEAAQSTLLSKSWYHAWLTRPDLNFDKHIFDIIDWDEFEKYATMTMQRYQDSRQKIESFRLLVPQIKYFSLKKQVTYYYRRNPLNKLIILAMKIGATDVEVEFPPSSLFLPQEVLASTTLLRLSLSKCRVEKKCVISCSSLKSLTLKYVLVKGDVFEDILRCCCISLEELSLYGCRGLALRPSDVYEFRKLRSLFLYLVDVSPMFSTEFASRFPCLKDLALHFCGGCRNIQIASTSLQTISFEPKSGSWRAKFDVPNIRKVTHSIFWLPSKLYINAAVREWEFDMSICSPAQFFEPSWFINLKKYLTKLRPSRILLNIDINNNLFEREEFEHEVNVEAVPNPLVVENLMISAPSSRCCALLLHLFGICRPKFVTHNWFSRECDDYLIGKNESLVILWKRLMKRMITPNSGIPDRSVFGKFGLEKVNVEVYEMFDAEWRPLLLEKPLDPSKDPERKRRIRFELIWED